jgi:hypothetical protein
MKPPPAKAKPNEVSCFDFIRVTRPHNAKSLHEAGNFALFSFFSRIELI